MSTLRHHLENNQYNIIRMGILIGVFIGAALLGILEGWKNPVYGVILSVAPLVLVGFVLILRRFDLMPIIILVAATFIPLSLPTGTESRIVDSLLLSTIFVGLWILTMLIIEKKLYLIPSPINKPILAFVLITILSFAWSNLFRDSYVWVPSRFEFVQLASTLVMIMLPATLLLVANLISQPKTLSYLTYIMIFAGIVGLLFNLFNVNTPVNSQGLFAMWVIGLSYGLALFNKKLNAFIRILLLILTAGWIYWGFVVNIQWIAGWLPGFVVIFVITLMKSKKLTLAIIILLLILSIFQIEYFQDVIAKETIESGNTRIAAWVMNWQVTREHLLLGTGPAGYKVYYMSYFPTQAMATHNNYIDILSQTGLFGLILILWLFIAITWTGYKLIIHLRGRGDFLEGLANAVFAGTLGCIVIMMFGDWMFPFAYTQTIEGFDHAIYNWIFLGVILVIRRILFSKPSLVEY
jgi:hypothetical protein